MALFAQSPVCVHVAPCLYMHRVVSITIMFSQSDNYMKQDVDLSLSSSFSSRQE